MDKVKQEALIAVGMATAFGEIALTVLPQGSVTTTIKLLLPALLALAARLKGTGMADLTALQSAVTELESAAQSVSTEVAQLKVDATSQASVDAVTQQVQGVVQSLQALSTPAA